MTINNETQTCCVTKVTLDMDEFDHRRTAGKTLINMIKFTK